MKSNLKIILGAALLLFLLTAAWVVAAPSPLWSLLQGQPARTGTDPLSPAEMAQAQQLALQSGPVAAEVSAAARSEVLLVERHQESKAVRQQGAWSRRADMYIYNYDTDTLWHSVVNLDSGAVDELAPAQMVQLPLTENEIALALQLSLADAQTADLIGREYQHLTGSSLIDPSRQLKVHALIFRADAMPENVSPGFADCGLHRCAQLILSTPTDALINLVPIVDLSARQLAGLDIFITE